MEKQKEHINKKSGITLTEKLLGREGMKQMKDTNTYTYICTCKIVIFYF